MTAKPGTLLGLSIVAVLLSGLVVLARVDVKVEYDKTFDFKPVRTWSWPADGAGQVMVARTQEDDPTVMKQRAEPIIIDAVTKELPRRGLQAATGGAGDVTIGYYLLMSTSMNAQTMGQFLPATVGWGLPPFAAATQSFEMMNAGALVLDVTAKGTVVWRGLAQAKITLDASPSKRESLLREAVRDLLKKFPPKS